MLLGRSWGLQRTHTEKSVQYYSLYLAHPFWIFAYTWVYTQAHIYPPHVYTTRWAHLPAQAHQMPVETRWTGHWDVKWEWRCDGSAKGKTNGDVWPLALTLVFSAFGIAGALPGEAGSPALLHCPFWSPFSVVSPHLAWDTAMTLQNPMLCQQIQDMNGLHVG